MSRSGEKVRLSVVVPGRAWRGGVELRGWEAVGDEALEFGHVEPDSGARGAAVDGEGADVDLVHAAAVVGALKRGIVRGFDWLIVGHDEG